MYSQNLIGEYAWKNSSGITTTVNFKKNNTFNYKSHSDLGPICYLNKGYYLKSKDTLTLIYDNPIDIDKVKIIEKSKIENKEKDIISSIIDFEIIDENNTPLLGTIIAAFSSKQNYTKAQSYNGDKLKFVISTCDNVKYFQVSYLTDEVKIPMEEFEGFHTHLKIKLYSEKKCRYSSLNKIIKYRILSKKKSELKLLQVDTNDKSILFKKS